MTTRPWPLPTLSKTELYWVLREEIGVPEEELRLLEVPEAETVPILEGLKLLGRIGSPEDEVPAGETAGPSPRQVTEFAGNGGETSHEAPRGLSLPELAPILRGLKRLVSGQSIPPAVFCPPPPNTWPSRAACDRFLQALALPEARIELAEATGFSYQQVTNWVIRADLLRVTRGDSPACNPDAVVLPAESPNAKAYAAILAARGILGVHDLADRKNRNALDVSPTDCLEGISPSELEQLANCAVNEAARSRPQIVAATEAVVVVKGAGVHRRDETLGGFLKGFWPAIVQMYPDATLVERQDALPVPAGGEDDEAEPRNRVAEVSAGERRIWIKEAYWEPGIRAPSSLSALLMEWRMATFVLGSVIWEQISDPQRSKRPWSDFPRYLISFFLAHFLVLLVIALAFWDIKSFESPIIQDNRLRLALGAALLVSLLLAIPAAWETQVIQQAGKQSKRREQLPGVASWLLIILIGTVLVHPVRYGLFLLTLVALQVVLVMARRLAWSHRDHEGSDTNLAEYDVYRCNDEVRIEKRSRGNWLQRFAASPALYRWIVVVALPIIVLLLLLARVLQAIPGLRWLGDVLEKLGDTTLGGGLGDIVVYANDPAQAAWIRRPIVAALEAFHERPDVQGIHVFAHSQGTPITFETLFYHLRAAVRAKIKTYVTIGSVLSYFHQANPVLDLLQITRFPRRPYPKFADGFKWFNFWNHGDPIPEFMALDAYDDYQPGEPPSAKPARCRDPFEEPLEAPVPSAANPVNVRTKGTWLPWTSHSEYWTNLAEVQEPFAQRVLGHPERRVASPMGPRRYPHALYVLAFWLPLALLLVILGWWAVVNVPPDWMPLRHADEWLKMWGWGQRLVERLEGRPLVDWLAIPLLAVAAVSILRQLLALRRFNNTP